MPCLNDLIEWRASRYRGLYSGKKREWTDRVVEAVKQAHAGAYAKPVRVHFELRESNKKRDPDGAFSGAAKFVLDGLVHAGVIANDGWRNIAALSCSWCVDEAAPGVLVTLT